MNLTDLQLNAIENHILATVAYGKSTGPGRRANLDGAREELKAAFVNTTEASSSTGLKEPVTPGRYESEEGMAYLVVYISPDDEVEYPVIGFEEGNGFDEPKCWTLIGRYYRDETDQQDLVKRLGDLP